MGEELLQRVMGIIATAGDGKSLALEAIAQCRAGDYSQAQSLLEQSEHSIGRAHDLHSKILFESAAHEEMSVTFLLVHAADYMTAAETTHDLAGEIIALYREVRHV